MSTSLLIKLWANRKHQKLDDQVGPLDLEQLDQDLILKVSRNAMLKEEDQQIGQETENPSAQAGGADVKNVLQKILLLLF